MKHILATLLLIFVFSASAQTIELSRTNINFGTIPMRPRSEQSVVLYNRNNKPMVINAITVDCSCTKVEWTKKPVPASDSTTIKVIYTPAESGIFYKKIKIVTTDGDQTVVIRGSVK